MIRPLAAAGLMLLLAACASTDAPVRQAAIPGGPTVISGSGGNLGDAGGAGMAMVAGPPGCAGPISEYQQIIDRDAETGHLNPGVYNRVATDLEPVKRACAEGREREAVGQLAALKARYGYR